MMTLHSRRTLIAAAACALAAAALPAAAFENKEEGVLEKEIVLGSSQPLSGTLAYMGKAVDEGMRTYFGMVNEKGGVNGRKIKLITYDDELKPAKSVANAKLLIERDNVLAMVGNIGHATNVSAYEYSSTKKVPTIGALSISDLTSTPPRELLYVLPSPQSTETAAYIDYAVGTLKAKKVAMLYQNDGWGKPAYDIAVKQLEKHGMKLVEAQSFERFATDLTSQVFKLKQAEPDVVVVYALGQEAVQFFRSAEKLGWKPTVFGAGGLNDPKFVELLGKTQSKLYVASYYDAIEGDNPAIQAFFARYTKTYPKSAPSSNALMGYSAAAVAVEALQRAGNEPSRAKVVAALDGLKDFDQKIGPKITFQPLNAGPYSRRGQTGVALMELKGDKFAPLGGYIDPVKR
ncbi:ABC transporter substrate-binding protein [uncultured Pseudacidovorax sp.]|uniref:ABC transporter substrate-binding protein n=1 Tax=uncultured Pseudacidovorax sp. TaxID=679313 RepID=UPI0025DA3DD9|nr:ABC transporter substrate-binding protein [uncultured Pseudacidovorax sp.]